MPPARCRIAGFDIEGARKGVVGPGTVTEFKRHTQNTQTDSSVTIGGWNISALLADHHATPAASTSDNGEHYPEAMCADENTCCRAASTAHGVDHSCDYNRYVSAFMQARWCSGSFRQQGGRRLGTSELRHPSVSTSAVRHRRCRILYFHALQSRRRWN